MRVFEGADCSDCCFRCLLLCCSCLCLGVGCLAFVVCCVDVVVVWGNLLMVVKSLEVWWVGCLFDCGYCVVFGGLLLIVLVTLVLCLVYLIGGLEVCLF